MTKQPKIIKSEENPETPEILADSIVRIADGFTKLLGQNLTEEGIVTLLKGMPGMTTVSKADIGLVLDNLKRIKSYYIRRPSRRSE